MLMRSLQRQLNADPAGRRITDHDGGPLFGSSSEEGDFGGGTIYVPRSNTKDPRIADHRDVIHKIGITGNDVEIRISSAKVDPTFLLADVEIVATYELSSVNRVKLENLMRSTKSPGGSMGAKPRPAAWDTL